MLLSHYRSSPSLSLRLISSSTHPTSYPIISYQICAAHCIGLMKGCSPVGLHLVWKINPLPHHRPQIFVHTILNANVVIMIFPSPCLLWGNISPQRKWQGEATSSSIFRTCGMFKHDCPRRISYAHLIKKSIFENALQLGNYGVLFNYRILLRSGQKRLPTSASRCPLIITTRTVLTGRRRKSQSPFALRTLLYCT